ncbi:Subtilisin-like protein [Glarea lozoyensis ATCC 20868]|uniref:Subtilisin-like protein n=1 Tax=Glarea lozoyensis (strain ATCC 20868 / MF5171) TaxID=1116229 RepID=S3CW33_GLAL2|nr:Subtilisin-like protein [Glarea lozoyensis ATCC 20868]EPE29825.1 Subtilisin-like protein [Glarea lozoyensis ATCC 20868]
MSTPLPFRKRIEPVVKEIREGGGYLKEEDYSADDDDDEDDEHKEKVRLEEITSIHGQIMKFFRNHDNPKADGKAITSLLSQNQRDNIQCVGTSGKNILHSMIERAAPNLRLAVWLLTNFDDLILGQNIDGNTPMYEAIKNDKAKFVHAVLSHSTRVLEALQLPGSDGICLHLAFKPSHTYKKIKKCQHEHVDKMILVLKNASVSGSSKDTETNSQNQFPSILKLKDLKGDTPLHIAIHTISYWMIDSKPPSSDSILPGMKLRARLLIEEFPGAVFEINNAGQYPYQCFGSDEVKECCYEVAEAMKKLYMREFTEEQVIKLFYPEGAYELSIFFDIPHTIDDHLPASLDMWLGHLHFESILKHVDLPNLVMERERNLPTFGTSNSDTAPILDALNGKVEFVKIFDWLRQKGVRTILEISVQDDELNPHCDEAIEVALHGLGVETLNWVKLDLNSDVLFHSAQEVKVLHLYSSGNNDVLRVNRSSFELLPGYITQGRSKTYLNEFAAALNNSSGNRIKVKPKEWRNKAGGYTGPGDDPGPTLRHPWLEVMDAFALALKNNPKHRDLQNRVAGGKSFFKRPDIKDRTIDYWAAPGGRGTQMARLVCRICPAAKLYPIRLDEGSGKDGEREIRLDSALNATDWAMQVPVHIISISWSINIKGCSLEDISNFDNIILAAINKGITIFCAASDSGKMTVKVADNENMPAKVSRSYHHRCCNLEWNSVRRWHQAAKAQPQSGSSLATAIAAGLGALLQYCVIIDGKTKKTDPELLTPDQMTTVLKRLCPTYQKKKFPEVANNPMFRNAGSLEVWTQVLDRVKFIAENCKAVSKEDY